MPIETPESRKEIQDRINSDVQANLPTSNPYLRNSFLNSIIKGLAGRIWDVYRTIQSLLKQTFWDTSTGDFLSRQAAWFGITLNPATQSSGNITVQGTATTIVPISTTLQTSDSLEIVTQASATISTNVLSITLTQTAGVATAITSSGHELSPNITTTISGVNETGYNGLKTILTTPTATSFTYSVAVGTPTPGTGTPIATHATASIEVQSSSFGQDANLIVGDAVTFTSPIAGVNDDGFVQFGGLQGGADQEEEESFRDRFLFRVQNPVALFNTSAIVNQAKLISGVTRVWVRNVDDTEVSVSVSSITRVGQVASLTTGAAHGASDGQHISVEGSNEVEYNETNVRCLVEGATEIVYIVAGSPASPATGTIVLKYSLVDEGQVKIYFTRDDDVSIIPSASEVTTVKDKILEIKPAHVSDSDVIVLSPIAVTANFTFTELTPDTTTMQDAIEANLDAFFREQTIVGEDVTKSQYDNVIWNTVDPETNDRVESFTESSPGGTVTVGNDSIAILGTVAF